MSVAFGSPLGGVLFGLEGAVVNQYQFFITDTRPLELDTFSKETDVMWRGFVISVIAAVSLQYVDPFDTKKLVLFGVSVTLHVMDSWVDPLPLGEFRDRRRVARIRAGAIP